MVAIRERVEQDWEDDAAYGSASGDNSGGKGSFVFEVVAGDSEGRKKEHALTNAHADGLSQEDL